MAHKLKFRLLAERLAVSQLPSGSPVPSWAAGPGFFCLTQTLEELSIVCDEARVPPDVRIERDWVALQLEGPFPFAMTGVLTSFLVPLADAAIPVFAVATFDTDYVLLKRSDLPAALRALSAAGHEQAGL